MEVFMDAKQGRKAGRRPGKGIRAKNRGPRSLVLIGCLLTCVWASTLAGQVKPPAARLADLQAPHIHWGEQQSIEMSGTPLHVRPFSSRLAATEVARSLATESRPFQRVTTLGDTLMLSGMQADAHWLAKIDVSATGSSGYVSVLPSASAGSAHSRQDLALHGWLPDGAVQLSQHRSVSKGRTLAQYVYTLGNSSDVSMAYVRQQLRRRGWKHDASFAGIGNVSAWRREGSDLTIFASPQAQGSALYIQHLE
jgi:hypothetical protein